ncbi:MAG: hypothetical protein N2517_07645, partial [Ignavibacteria bacterium]|nr:hypothetical protein [Ignavibacteria bacterium]
MEKVNVCIACGSIQITSFNKAGFTFFKCQICGLVRKVDTSSEYIYEKGYYLRKEAKNKYGIQVWNFARYPENIKLITEIMQFVPPPATLVDVGCSYG